MSSSCLRLHVPPLREALRCCIILLYQICVSVPSYGFSSQDEIIDEFRICQAGGQAHW